MEIEQSGRNKLVEVVKLGSKPRLNFSDTLRALGVGETIRFPVGSNISSLRTIATINGIRLQMRALDSGEIEVTRRPDRPKRKVVVKSEEKLYDL